jgi:hypothetical protein
MNKEKKKKKKTNKEKKKKKRKEKKKYTNKKFELSESTAPHSQDKNKIASEFV